MEEDLTKLTVVQLKERLTEKGLDTKGKKADLLKRLEASIETAEENNEVEMKEEPDKKIKTEEESTENAEGGDAKTAPANGEKGSEVSTVQSEWEPADEEDQDQDIRTDFPVPKKEELKRNRMRELNKRHRLVAPIKFTDFKSEWLQNMLNQCQFATFKCSVDGSVTTDGGTIDLQFLKNSYAVAAETDVPGVRDGMTCKPVTGRPIPASEKERLTKETQIKPNDLLVGDRVDELAERSLYVKGIPADATDESVYSLFPSALLTVVVRERETRKEDCKCKGHAYVEYASREEAIEAYREVPDLQISGKKLLVVHYGLHYHLHGIHALPPYYLKQEGIMNDETRWFYIKLWRAVRKRLASSFGVNVNDRKALETKEGWIQKKFISDNKDREEAGMKKKKLPSDLHQILYPAKATPQANKKAGGNKQAQKRPSSGPAFQRDNKRGRGGSYSPKGRGGFNQRGGGFKQGQNFQQRSFQGGYQGGYQRQGYNNGGGGGYSGGAGVGRGAGNNRAVQLLSELASVMGGQEQEYGGGYGYN